MLGMLPHITLVVPAALAFAAASPGDFDQCDFVILIGEQFSPRLTADLQLGHQQPIAESIHFGMTVFIEPAQSGLKVRTVGLKTH